MKKKKVPKQRKLGKILAIDFATSCWEEPKDQPAGQKVEIIEIGIAPINLETLEIDQPTSILIKPVNCTISDFCTEVTGISQDMVDTGLSFKEASEKIIKDFDSKNRMWISWGSFDKWITQYQCKDQQVPYMFGGGHYNLESLFAILYGIADRTCLFQAMKLLNIEAKENSHRAVDNAEAIANIFSHTLSKCRMPIEHFLQ